MASEGSTVTRRYNYLLPLLRSPMYTIGAAFLVFLVVVAASNVLTGEYTPEQFIQQLIFGLSQGSIYSLIALGYTLVYGILFMINFAHGEVFMAGAYMGFFTIYGFQQSGFLQEHTFLALLGTLIAGMLASVVVAVLLERIAYRPLRNAPRLVPLIRLLVHQSRYKSFLSCFLVLVRGVFLILNSTSFNHYLRGLLVRLFAEKPSAVMGLILSAEFIL
ncbi:MAG: hypothetical protein Kow00117_12020 [Phototrophicales bacterium]